MWYGEAKASLFARQEFLQARKKGIGGSDAASVFGLSPYATPLQLYLEKTGQLPDKTTPQEQEVFERGNVLEPLLKTLFTKNYGLEVEDCEQAVHKKYDFIVGHVDGLVPHDKAIVECKTSCSFSKDQWGEELTDNIPKHYLLQAHHYLLIHDSAEKVYLPVLRGTSDMLKLLTSLVKKYGVDIKLTPTVYKK